MVQKETVRGEFYGHPGGGEIISGHESITDLSIHGNNPSLIVCGDSVGIVEHDQIHVDPKQMLVRYLVDPLSCDGGMYQDTLLRSREFNKFKAAGYREDRIKADVYGATSQIRSHKQTGPIQFCHGPKGYTPVVSEGRSEKNIAYECQDLMSKQDTVVQTNDENSKRAKILGYTTDNHQSSGDHVSNKEDEFNCGGEEKAKTELIGTEKDENKDEFRSGSGKRTIDNGNLTNKNGAKGQVKSLDGKRGHRHSTVGFEKAGPTQTSICNDAHSIQAKNDKNLRIGDETENFDHKGKFERNCNADRTEMMARLDKKKEADELNQLKKHIEENKTRVHQEEAEKEQKLREEIRALLHTKDSEIRFREKLTDKYNESLKLERLVVALLPKEMTDSSGESLPIERSDSEDEDQTRVLKVDPLDVDNGVEEIQDDPMTFSFTPETHEDCSYTDNSGTRCSFENQLTNVPSLPELHSSQQRYLSETDNADTFDIVQGPDECGPSETGPTEVGPTHRTSLNKEPTENEHCFSLDSLTNSLDSIELSNQRPLTPKLGSVWDQMGILSEASHQFTVCFTQQIQFYIQDNLDSINVDKMGHIAPEINNKKAEEIERMKEKNLKNESMKPEKTDEPKESDVIEDQPRDDEVNPEIPSEEIIEGAFIDVVKDELPLVSGGGRVNMEKPSEGTMESLNEESQVEDTEKMNRDDDKDIAVELDADNIKIVVDNDNNAKTVDIEGMDVDPARDTYEANMELEPEIDDEMGIGEEEFMMETNNEADPCLEKDLFEESEKEWKQYEGAPTAFEVLIKEPVIETDTNQNAKEVEDNSFAVEKDDHQFQTDHDKNQNRKADKRKARLEKTNRKEKERQNTIYKMEKALKRFMPKASQIAAFDMIDSKDVILKARKGKKQFEQTRKDKEMLMFWTDWIVVWGHVTKQQSKREMFKVKVGAAKRKISDRKHDIPVPSHCEIRGRRCELFKGGNSGRQCSDAGEGSGGRGGNGHSRSGGKSGSNQNGYGNNNSNNNAENNGDSNNNRKKPDRSGNKNMGGNNDNSPPTPTNDPEDVILPARNFKYPRKRQHCNLSVSELTEILVKITAEHESSGKLSRAVIEKAVHQHHQKYSDVALCVANSLQYMEDMPDDIINCEICSLVNSFLKHFANCVTSLTESSRSKCTMCIQIFSLICWHIHDCMNTNGSVGSIVTGDKSFCTIGLCIKITDLLNGKDIFSQLKVMWFQVKRILARSVDGIDEEEELSVITPSVPVDPPPFQPSQRPHRVSMIMPPNLEGIPENRPLQIVPGSSPSNSRVLVRKRSNLARFTEQDPTSSQTSADTSGAIVSDTTSFGASGNSSSEDIGSGTSVEPNSITSNDGKTDKSLPDNQSKQPYARPESREDEEFESDTLPINDNVVAVVLPEVGTPMQVAELPSNGSSSGGSIEFGVFNKGGQYVSLPTGPPGPHNAYFPSMKEKPTGIRGIDEVVYDNKDQLVKVVRIWDRFKTQYLIEARLAKHYREEGVILKEFKDKLHIKGLRYNNNFQWVKVAHLGNGMTGKCHLATDFDTDFKFCVKEIHISNYEPEEIELWSQLDHPYIVQVYGAIRHGEKIYILQEFIEGGCLTEAINEQRKLGQRLSQLTAVRYFKQLLEVLVYLQSRNILHEDLKADNILLNNVNGEVSIKVTDFGMAKRIQGFVRKRVPPVGTQTQWSPEKAKAMGYGFPAEVWAAVCVLIHMLSGQPPWVKRHGNLGALILVIVEQSPPVEDIPRNINEAVRDLICQGLTVCQGQRPAADKLLEHTAFNLLKELDNPAFPSIKCFSLLDPPFFNSTNQIDDNNEDLQRILEGLKVKDEPQRTGSIKDVHPRAPSLVPSSRVPLEGPNAQSFKKTVDQSVAPSERHSSTKCEPSFPEQNLNALEHIYNFFSDTNNLVPEQTNLIVMTAYQSGNSPGNEDDSEHSSGESRTTSQEAIRAQLPNFSQLLSTSVFPDIPGPFVSPYFHTEDSDNEQQDDSIEDDEEQYKKFLAMYLPNTLNIASEGTPPTEEPVSSVSASIQSSSAHIADEDEDQVQQNPDSTKQSSATNIDNQNLIEAQKAMALQTSYEKIIETAEGFRSLSIEDEEMLYRSGTSSPTELGFSRPQESYLDAIPEVSQTGSAPPTPVLPSQHSSPNDHKQENRQQPRLEDLQSKMTTTQEPIWHHGSQSQGSFTRSTSSTPYVPSGPPTATLSRPLLRANEPIAATARPVQNQPGQMLRQNQMDKPRADVREGKLNVTFAEPRPNQSMDHFRREQFRFFEAQINRSPTQEEKELVLSQLEHIWMKWQERQKKEYPYMRLPDPTPGFSMQTGLYSPHNPNQGSSASMVPSVASRVQTSQSSPALASRPYGGSHSMFPHTEYNNPMINTPANQVISPGPRSELNPGIYSPGPSPTTSPNPQTSTGGNPSMLPNTMPAVHTPPNPYQISSNTGQAQQFQGHSIQGQGYILQGQQGPRLSSSTPDLQHGHYRNDYQPGNIFTYQNPAGNFQGQHVDFSRGQGLPRPQYNMQSLNYPFQGQGHSSAHGQPHTFHDINSSHNYNSPLNQPPNSRVDSDQTRLMPYPRAMDQNKYEHYRHERLPGGNPYRERQTMSSLEASHSQFYDTSHQQQGHQYEQQSKSMMPGYPHVTGTGNPNNQLPSNASNPNSMAFISQQAVNPDVQQSMGFSYQQTLTRAQTTQYASNSTYPKNIRSSPNLGNQNQQFFSQTSPQLGQSQTSPQLGQNQYGHQTTSMYPGPQIIVTGANRNQQSTMPTNLHYTGAQTDHRYPNINQQHVAGSQQYSQGHNLALNQSNQSPVQSNSPPLLYRHPSPVLEHERMLRRHLAPTSTTGQPVKTYGNFYNLSPAINPRPPKPDGCIKNPELRLDINKAKDVSRHQSTFTHAATAPVESPPKRAHPSPEYMRNNSYIPPTGRAPLNTSTPTSQSSSHTSLGNSSALSTSHSKSKFEEQEELLNQLGRWAEDELSQHSDPLQRYIASDPEGDEEFNSDEINAMDPVKSLALYLNDDDDINHNSLTVTFVYEDQTEKMRFSGDQINTTWQRVIDSELAWIPRDFGLERYSLRQEDGSLIDLESHLVPGTMTITVTAVTDDDSWWVEKGGIIVK